MKDIIADCGTSDIQLNELGQLYYDLIMERRSNPTMSVKIPPIIRIGNKDYVSLAEDQSTQTRIKRMQKLSDLQLKAGFIIGIGGELISNFTSYDIGIISRSPAVGSLGGAGFSRLLVWIDKSLVMPLEDWKITRG